MSTERYDHCTVYWQGPGNYMVNDRIHDLVIVIGGFWPDVYDIQHSRYVTYCQTPDEAAKLAES